jgi:hypothetical protein
MELEPGIAHLFLAPLQHGTGVSRPEIQMRNSLAGTDPKTEDSAAGAPTDEANFQTRADDSVCRVEGSQTEWNDAACRKKSC